MQTVSKLNVKPQGIYSNKLVYCVSKELSGCYLITWEGFTYSYVINVLCVIKGFYRTSIVT